MTRQIPIGPKELICPLHKKSMDKVCNTCPLWVLVRGKNPQSNEEIDRWDCSLAWLPILLIENAQTNRQTAASVESFRNRLVERVPIPPDYTTDRGNSIALLPTEIMQIKGN